MRLLRQLGSHKAAPDEAPDNQGPWVTQQRPDRSEQAVALNLPHRYRGGLIMLRTGLPAKDPDRVVRIKSLGVTGGPRYLCWDRLGNLMDLAEDELVAPDEAALRAAIEGAGPGAPDAGWSRFYRVLRTAYVWMTSEADQWQGDRSYEEWLHQVWARLKRGAFGDVKSTPLQVFTDLDRAEESHRRVKVRVVAARVPFVVACRLAELFGDSESINFNPGAEPFGALPLNVYRRFSLPPSGS